MLDPTALHYNGFPAFSGKVIINGTPENRRAFLAASANVAETNIEIFMKNYLKEQALGVTVSERGNITLPKLPDSGAYGITATWNDRVGGEIIVDSGSVHSDNKSFSASGNNLTYRQLLNLHG